MPKARNKPPVPQTPPAAVPPLRALTVPQLESEQPGIKKRGYMWVHRALAGDPNYAWLIPCILHVGRSVFICGNRFGIEFSKHAGMLPTASRRGSLDGSRRSRRKLTQRAEK
jgi:hypothetical protein